MARQSETNRRLEEVERLLTSADKSLALIAQHLETQDERIKDIEEELEPVTTHVAQMRGAAKLLAIIGILVTILATVVAI